MRRLTASIIVSSAIVLAIAVALVPGSGVNAQIAPGGGGFASPPAYSADGFAFAVYQGGSIDQMKSDARNVGAAPRPSRARNAATHPSPFFGVSEPLGASGRGTESSASVMIGAALAASVAWFRSFRL